MAAEFERLSKLEFFKWKKEDENWASFLAELRTAILMTQRQVNTRAARTKELATSGQRDNLVNLMTVLEDLCDLEATAITTYVTALKVSSDPETLATIEAEETASKEFAAMTQACIKAATKIAKNVSEKLDEKAAREMLSVSLVTLRAVTYVTMAVASRSQRSSNTVIKFTKLSL